MRKPNEILADICSAFGIDIDTYTRFVTGKRPPDHIALITMGFIYVMVNSSFMNMTDISKFLGKSPSAISTAHTKVCQLLKSKTRYSISYKETLAKSCEEAQTVFNKSLTTYE